MLSCDPNAQNTKNLNKVEEQVKELQKETRDAYIEVDKLEKRFLEVKEEVEEINRQVQEMIEKGEL